MCQIQKFEDKIFVKNGKQYIFDPLRKKNVALTPEEFVRQHFIDFMITKLGYPAGLIAIEKSIIVNGMRQRADILLYNRKGMPVMIVECKASDIEIGQATIEQAARYNIGLGVKYIVVTNGKTNYCIKLDSLEKNHKVLSEFPTIEEVIN